MSTFNGLSGGGLEQKWSVLKWKCNYCYDPELDNKSSFIDGICTTCSNPFDSQELDQISDDDMEVTNDPKIIYQISSMMGWFCSSCSSYNRNLTRSDFELGNINCNCGSCANELNPEEDGDYILKNGPSASTPAGAVKAMVERNIRIMSRIQAEKAGRVLRVEKGMSREGIKPRVSPVLRSLGKTHRQQILAVLEEQYPKWYWGTGAGVVLLAGFLAYKGFEEKDIVIHVDGFEWSRNIAVDSVQRLSKSDWAEDVDGSIYQTERFYEFLENKRYYRTTGREYNHNSAYCYTTPESETYIDYRQECTIQTSYSQSCTATSGGGVSCSQTPSTSTSCVSIPETKVRYYDEEHCKYVDFDVNDWAHNRNLATSGDNQNEPSPYWHSFTPVGNNYTLGSERESGRKEIYTIHVSYKDGEKTDELHIPQNIWQILSITSECSAKASFLQGVNVDTIDWERCNN